MIAQREIEQGSGASCQALTLIFTLSHTTICPPGFVCPMWGVKVGEVEIGDRLASEPFRAVRGRHMQIGMTRDRFYTHTGPICRPKCGVGKSRMNLWKFCPASGCGGRFVDSL